MQRLLLILSSRQVSFCILVLYLPLNLIDSLVTPDHLCDKLHVLDATENDEGVSGSLKEMLENDLFSSSIVTC